MRLKVDIDSSDYAILEHIAKDRNESLEYTVNEIIRNGIVSFSWATGCFDWEG